MSDPHYPSVDTNFLENLVIESGKVIPNSKIKVGDTTAFVLDGNINKAMHKRLIVFRELRPNEISFEIATALAIKLNFMGDLLTWFENNKNWKDGGYRLPSTE